MGDPGRRIAVVVVNWNNAPDTLACLASLREHDPSVDVIVVDNGSDDGSTSEIERHCRPATMLRNTVNEGFTGGANAGLQHALGAGYASVALLNSDALLTGPALTGLDATVRAAPRPAAVSPRIVTGDDPSRSWFAGGVIDNGVPRHLQQDEIEGRTGVQASQWLSGCCLLATREVWAQVGLLDDRYFLFYEDCDWSARARAGGVELLVDLSIVIRHGGSRSFRGPASMLGTYYHVRNGLRYRREYQVGGQRAVLREVAASPLRGRSGHGERMPAWPYGWLGAFAGLLGSGGPAPRWVVRLAGASARRLARHGGLDQARPNPLRST